MSDDEMDKSSVTSRARQCPETDRRRLRRSARSMDSWSFRVSSSSSSTSSAGSGSATALEATDCCSLWEPLWVLTSSSSVPLSLMPPSLVKLMLAEDTYSTTCSPPNDTWRFGVQPKEMESMLQTRVCRFSSKMIFGMLL
eukprot:CAMPEP_0178410074 /NCGR_PEP_ID=MMETSP0689_2-20121128/20791_1 /TAXON_ID=160604 /ORGANISM="Amphidinium massartii, Strain CS-259" /LENGTH=139 /DNA_ID=CAMNT_0020031237 /DNA_START=17 /DNA_END=436 /DNA_ORIENTATION=+